MQESNTWIQDVIPCFTGSPPFTKATAVFYGGQNIRVDWLILAGRGDRLPVIIDLSLLGWSTVVMPAHIVGYIYSLAI